MSKVSFRLFALVLLLTACSSDKATSPSPSHDSIAGNYGGALVGTNQGVTLTSTLSLTIGQTGGTLSGSWALSGILSDGFNRMDILGTGTIAGTIQPGNNPSVSVTITPAVCPNRATSFSGAYDSANKRLTLTGPIQIFDTTTCNALLTYSSTVILNR